MITKKYNPLQWIPTGYFAMGLPFVILNLVAPIMFTDFGISDAQIAFWTSLIILPWSLKPIWSPIMELYRTKKFFVITTQFISGISLALVAISLSLPDFFVYAIAIMTIIGFSGATHDVALDGIYMHELSKEQQAKYIGWQGAFYNIAKVVAMGGLVYVAGILEGRIGAMSAWMLIMGVSGGVMICLAAYHIKNLPKGGEVIVLQDRSLSTTFKEIWSVIRDFFMKKHILIFFAFIFFYRLAEGMVIKIVPLFLKADRLEQGMGLSKEEIGLYYGTFGVVAFVCGSILGGHFISKIGLKKAIFPLCCIFNIPFAVYALLAYYQPESTWLICGSIVFEYFSYGFGYVGLPLYIMQQIAVGKNQMAHYAFGTSLANLGVMIPGMISGFLSDACQV